MNKKQREYRVKTAFETWEQSIQGGLEGYVKIVVEAVVRRQITDMIQRKLRSGSVFQQQLDTAVTKWVKKVVTEDKLVAQPYRDGQLRQELKRTFARTLSWKLDQKARDEAEKIVDNTIKKVLGAQLKMAGVKAKKPVTRRRAE